MKLTVSMIPGQSVIANMEHGMTGVKLGQGRMRGAFRAGDGTPFQ
ncbi:hypothetical protein [Paracoccus saliphilus]|uniref:Uncharacterized protein n=1 Tax=Paracoccus saliphilus TaxID=405559 RepID=A0AA45W515_9RHOB|nr:hypothetical protein [Paracoccus saliphilus]SIS89872.1 hypothetical protein SAMN05421772_1084 [Paracoccus saliphilus]